MKISKKAGPHFRNNPDGLFNPINNIIDEFIEYKKFSDKTWKRASLKKSIIKHLKGIQSLVLTQTDGVDLPNMTGRLQVMGFVPLKPGINWKETNRLRIKKNINKHVFFENHHTQGHSYKTYYRTSYNSTNGIKFAYFKNKDLWSFKQARLLGEAMGRLILSNSQPIYHTITKDYVSNRKEYLKYRGITKLDTEW